MNENIPRVIIPDDMDYFTFVQLYIFKKPFVIFDSQSLCGLDILKNTLDEFGLEYDINKDNKFSVLNGEHYKTAGMGLARKIGNNIFINPTKDKKLNLGPNREHFEKIKPYLPNGLKIKFWGEF